MTSTTPTLEDILAQSRSVNYPPPTDSVHSLAAFHDFLKSTHCDENLQFILITDSFVSDEYHTPAERFPLKLWNNSVYLQFLKQDSPQECNLPQDIREVFDRCYNSQTAPSKESIMAARQHIWALLQDAFNKFHRKIKCDVEGCGCGTPSYVPLLSSVVPGKRHSDVLCPSLSESAISDDDEHEPLVRCPPQRPRLKTDVACYQKSSPLQTPSSSFSNSSGLSSARLKTTGKKLVYKFKFNRRSSSSSSNGGHQSTENI